MDSNLKIKIDNPYPDYVLRKAILPKNLKELPSAAFNNCTSLCEVIIGGDVEKIGDFCFNGCRILRIFTISSKGQLRIIGNSAFRDCISLISFTFPESIEEIGNSAFINCTSLDIKGNIKNIKRIGGFAFANCHSLNDIYLPYVTLIEEGTFMNCIDIKEISILSVLKIKRLAFCGCKGLKNIELSSELTTIGDGVFQNCINLRAIELPNGLINIGDPIETLNTSIKKKKEKEERKLSNVFRNCASLLTITIPKYTRINGEGNFLGCKDLIIYIDKYNVTYDFEREDEDSLHIYKELVVPCVCGFSYCYIHNSEKKYHEELHSKIYQVTSGIPRPFKRFSYLCYCGEEVVGYDKLHNKYSNNHDIINCNCNMPYCRYEKDLHEKIYHQACKCSCGKTIVLDKFCFHFHPKGKDFYSNSDSIKKYEYCPFKDYGCNFHYLENINPYYKYKILYAHLYYYCKHAAIHPKTENYFSRNTDKIIKGVEKLLKTGNRLYIISNIRSNYRNNRGNENKKNTKNNKNKDKKDDNENKSENNKNDEYNEDNKNNNLLELIKAENKKANKILLKLRGTEIKSIKRFTNNVLYGNRSMCLGIAKDLGMNALLIDNRIYSFNPVEKTQINNLIRKNNHICPYCGLNVPDFNKIYTHLLDCKKKFLNI